MLGCRQGMIFFFRKARKERKLKSKKQHRRDLKMDLPDDRLDYGDDIGVFSLSKIRSKQASSYCYYSETCKIRLLLGRAKSVPYVWFGYCFAPTDTDAY
jgi:hypothetical protein